MRLVTLFRKRAKNFISYGHKATGPEKPMHKFMVDSLMRRPNGLELKAIEMMKLMNHI